MCEQISNIVNFVLVNRVTPYFELKELRKYFIVYILLTQAFIDGVSRLEYDMLCSGKKYLDDIDFIYLLYIDLKKR